MKNILYFENNYKINIGKTLFYIGIFLLPSALSIAAILLAISSVIGFFIQEDNYFNDKWNIPFFIATLLLFLSSLVNSFKNIGIDAFEVVVNINSYIGLFNWVPFTFSFYGFQAYLRSKRARKISSLLLLSGTVPVFISIVGQAFLEWHGPMQTLNGLIVWYQRPTNGLTAITGLFNNPNYLGSWLIIVWPFSLASFFWKDNNLIKKIINLFFIFFISLSIVFCASRGAWMGLFFSVPLFFGIKSFKWFVPFLIFIGVIFFSIFIPIFGNNFQELMKEIIPYGIWSNFDLSIYSNDISRFDIWQNALNMIYKNPLFGSGFSSFPDYIMSQTGAWKGHSHNLVLELMLSYGIPAALLIIVPFTLLIKTAFKKVFIDKGFFLSKNIFDRSWLISMILLALIHLVDIQYYDGRISIAGWILLAGIRNIIKDDFSKKNN